MPYTITNCIGVIASVSALLVSPLSVAQSAVPPAESAGADRWGELGNVTLDETLDTVEAVLIAVSKQAGFGLAIPAATEELAKPFTMVISDRPAGEVLDIIEESTPLHLEMKNGILLVRTEKSADPTAPAKGTEEGLTISVKEDPNDENGFNIHARYKHPEESRRRKKRVKFNAPVVVEKDEHLRTAVSIGGDTTVFGHLDRDAVSIGGNVTVKSGAVVEGTAVSVGGKVIIEPGAVVEDKTVSVGGKVEVAEDAEGGDQVSLPIPLPMLGGLAGAAGGLIVLHILGAIARSIFLFALALLLVWLIPKRIETARKYIKKKPGISILSGFLVFAALIPLFVVLALTIIGIPLIPVVALILAALIIFGLSGVISWLGYRLPVFRENKTPVKAIIIGFVAFTLLNIIPLVGSVVLILATLAGVGAAFQSRFGRQIGNDT